MPQQGNVCSHCGRRKATAVGVLCMRCVRLAAWERRLTRAGGEREREREQNAAPAGGGDPGGVPPAG